MHEPRGNFLQTFPMKNRAETEDFFSYFEQKKRFETAKIIERRFFFASSCSHDAREFGERSSFVASVDKS